jgi:hypothetical protein
MNRSATATVIRGSSASTTRSGISRAIARYVLWRNKFAVACEFSTSVGNGGEELAILMFGVSFETAARVAKRIPG